MAKINATDVIRHTVKELQLDPARDKMPDEIEDKVKVVYVLNDKFDIDTLTLFASFANGTVITVPDNEFWEVEHMNVRLTATATVGSRTLIVEVDSENASLLAQFAGDGTTTASAIRNHNFSYRIATTDQIQSGIHFYGHFLKYLKPGWTITFSERLGVDSADSVAVVMMIRRHKI